ncbi:MAG: cysteine desulfurase family protein [Nanoarchaeota archaeon]
MKKLCFDNNATTRVDEEVVKSMNKVMLEDYGNPSSSHAFGDSSNKIVLESRINIARHLGARANEIFFTSGTTESNNWALFGLAKSYPNRKKILISSIEHPSVRAVCLRLEHLGYKIVEIPVDNDGFVDLNFIERNIDSNTLVVSVIHGNNVFGTIQNLKKIGDICKNKNVLFHTDVAQTFGKMKIFVHDWNIDLLSASAHKISGPKGIGLLYIRDGVKITPLIYGGGQENGLRSGTENVPGIVGFSKSLDISYKNDWKAVSEIRDYLIEKLGHFGAKLVGSSKCRIQNNIFVTFSGINAEKLLYDLSNKGVYVSIGSACDSKKEKEDSVLKAIGLSTLKIKSSIRISLPVDITKKDADYFLKILKELIR